MPRFPRPRNPIAPWVAAILGVAVGYPIVVHAALGRFGVRPVALVALAIAAFATWRAFRGAGGLAAVLQAVATLLLAVSAWSGARAPLLFIPALIQVGLAALFVRSVFFDPPSMVERVARHMEPLVPEFIGEYCRAVTGAWAFFFAANAVFIFVLAFEGDTATWAAWTGGGLYVLAMMLQGVEYVVRKLWFRAYDDTPIDRVWERCFPAEATERGRRSVAHITEMKRQLEAERAAGGER